MEEFEDEDDFGGVETGGVFVESLGFAEVGEYFAARAIVKLEFVRFYPKYLGRVFLQAYIKNRGQKRT